MMCWRSFFGLLALLLLQTLRRCDALDAAPVDCYMSQWQEWSVCSKTCGSGQKSRQRTIITAPQNGGRACVSLSEVAECNTEACSDCEVGLWSLWTECSTTCDEGEQVRNRDITRQPSSGGTACPDLQEAKACYPVQCPKDCVVDDWNSWSVCTKTCGTGTKERTRTVKKPQAGDGAPCPLLAEAADCNQDPCEGVASQEADCKVGPWGFWTECTMTCGSGQQMRKRDIKKEPSEKGKKCPDVEEFTSCNTQVCDVDCLLSDWAPWGGCYQSEEGDCVKQSDRTIVTEKSGTGNVCPVRVKYENCDSAEHCSAWYHWPERLLYVAIVGAVAVGIFAWYRVTHPGVKRAPARRGVELTKTDPESEVLTNGKANLPPFVETKPPLEYEPLMQADILQPPPPIIAPVSPPVLSAMSTQRAISLNTQPTYTMPMYTNPMSTGMSTASPFATQPQAFRTMPMGGASPFVTRR